MNRNRLKDILSLCLLSYALFFTGCSRVIRLQDVRIDPPPLKIPVKVGLHMSPAFRKYVHRFTNFLSVAVGEGMTSGVENAMEKTFQEVYILDTAEVQSLSEYGVKAVVVPEIVETAEIAGLGPLKNEFHVICKWTIFDMRGKILYMDTVRGVARAPKYDGEHLSMALKDNIEKFSSHMRSTKWWENMDTEN